MAGCVAGDAEVLFYKGLGLLYGFCFGGDGDGVGVAGVVVMAAHEDEELRACGLIW